LDCHGKSGTVSDFFVITALIRSLLTYPVYSYINQKLNELISGFIAMETETTYNRGLEKEVSFIECPFRLMKVSINHLIFRQT
jgi:hypothetical protein